MVRGLNLPDVGGSRVESSPWSDGRQLFLSDKFRGSVRTTSGIAANVT